MWRLNSEALHYGSHGPTVEHLQELLNSRLRYRQKLLVDGNFGAQTEAAVRRYQASVGLAVDGIVGPRTLQALEQRLKTAAVSSTPVPAAFPDAPWMAIALQEQGQEEIEGPEHNPRIIQYHNTTSLRATTDETPWCSSFVNWCLRQAGITGTNSAAATSWLTWGAPSSPIAGAITVIHNHAAAGGTLTSSGYHVAFLVRETGSHYHLLGGNQSDQVKITHYPRDCWRVVGLRWPQSARGK